MAAAARASPSKLNASSRNFVQILCKSPCLSLYEFARESDCNAGHKAATCASFAAPLRCRFVRFVHASSRSNRSAKPDACAKGGNGTHIRHLSEDPIAREDDSRVLLRHSSPGAAGPTFGGRSPSSRRSSQRSMQVKLRSCRSARAYGVGHGQTRAQPTGQHRS